MWLRFRVLARDGAWPLPRLLERRNVFWRDDTERTLDGRALAMPGDGWLWPELRARHPSRSSHDVVLGGGLRVRAAPVEDAVTSTALPRGSYVAVVIDRSYSMKDVSETLAHSIERLERAAAGTARIDWYLPCAPSRGEPGRVAGLIDTEDLIFFGGHSTSHLVEQFDRLRHGRDYHAVIVLTDSGGYDLEPETPPAIDFDSPLWLVHLDGELPIAYSDPVVATMRRTGGGITFDVEELLGRLAVTKTHQHAYSFLRDGYRWEVEPTNASAAGQNGFAPLAAGQNGFAPLAAGQNGFAPLAARAAIDALASSLPQRPGAVALDELHTLAREHEIVTGYSSMLVLVNDWQREALRHASEADDRFDRENEAGKEQMTAPASPSMVSGVPEPEGWALLVLGLCILVIWMRRKGWRPAMLRIR
jgi:putative PEP-CTERM system integral membrane protein